MNPIDDASEMSAANTSTYSPYGYHPNSSGLLGFNGERPDPMTGNYLLGNGLRAFSPGLMRFNSPDSFSPFKRGGLNAYGYCQGDPINWQDPSGHFRFWRGLSSAFSGRAHIPDWHGALLKGEGKYHRLEVRMTMLEPVHAPAHTSNNLPPDYVFAGYHGGIRSSTWSLESGVQPQRHQIVDHGQGFYFTRNYGVAERYANAAAKLHKGEARVFGVYIKDFDVLVAAGKIKKIWNGKNEATRESYLIEEHAFTNIRVRRPIVDQWVLREPFGDY